MLHKYIAAVCFFIMFTIYMPLNAMSMNNVNNNSDIVVSLKQKTTDSPKWRVVYVDGGAYIDFPYIFKATIDAMHSVGLIDKKYPYEVVNEKSTKEIWQWIAENAGGNYIEFLKDGFYSGDWDEKKRKEQKAALLERIRTKNDVDIIITFGTGAGRDMATSEHNIPVFSMSVTDAVQAGIVRSVEDSGLDHVHGQIELGRHGRQLTIFHDVFKFKKLGVPVPNTAEGEASIAYGDVLHIAKKRNFEVVPCVLDFHSREDAAFQGLKQCIETLSPQVDAIYMTTTAGMQWDKMPQLLAPIIKAEIPSFSQNGIRETQLGILMSIAQSSFSSEGMHGANAIKQLIEGAKPRDIGQVFEGPVGLALNLEMARLIGWNPPFEILVAVDAVYHEIYSAKDIK